jgi:hypothetical protein
MRGVIGSGILAVVAAAVGIGGTACSGGSDSTANGANAISNGSGSSGSPASGAATPAGTPTSGSTSTTPAPPPSPTSTVLLDCIDNSDVTRTAHLTVDSAFAYTWKIGEGSVSGSLVSVDPPSNDLNEYILHGTDGFFVTLDPTTLTVFESGVDLECDPASAKLDKAALDNLVQLTAASRARQQTFATCQISQGGGSMAPSTWTVRPALGGPGALIEGEAADANFALMTSTISSGADGKTTYKGTGGSVVVAAGQHTTPFTTLTGTPGSTAGTTVFSWDADDGAPEQALPTNTCTVTGLDFAKTLLASH